MPGKPHSDSAEEKTVLRDSLAVNRTVLANERTFLSYIRTSLALLGAGAFCLRFFDSAAAEITGWILVFLGILTVIIGKIKYRSMKKTIERQTKNADASGVI